MNLQYLMAVALIDGTVSFDASHSLRSHEGRAGAGREAAGADWLAIAR